MAGSWFVDPEDGLETNNGLSPDIPWKLIPGQTGATAQTGYGVVAGDVINVRNGSRSTLRVVPPASNLTYQGYGLAENVLVLTLPVPNAPWMTFQLPVVREVGVHEGMWTIDARANDLSGGAGISLGTRTGCTFMDFEIIGPQVGTRDAFGAASSGDNTSGLTLSRFRIEGATQRGISAYIKNPTITYGQIAYTKDDNIGLLASTANGYRSGGVATLRYLDLREPNQQAADVAATGTQGDCIQTVTSIAAAEWNEALRISDICFTKSSAGKQIMTLVDASAGITVERFNVRGSGTNQIVHGNLRGDLKIRNGHWSDFAGSNDNMLVRFEGITTPPVSYGMDTGSSLTIENLSIQAQRFPGVYHCTETSASWEFDGTIAIRNVTGIGAVNDNAFSFASNLAAFWSATSQTSFGSNFQLYLHNNAIQVYSGEKPNVILPSGVAGDSAWVIEGNSFQAGASYMIGSTSYATLALFEAAHAEASGNTDSDPMLTAQCVPLTGSPLLTSGADLGWRRDIRGILSRRHVGAYGAGRLVAA